MVFRTLLSLMLVIVVCLETHGSIPIYVKRKKDASVVPNASVDIFVSTDQTGGPISSGCSGPNGEPWNTNATLLNRTQEYRVIAKTKNQDASGWADIKFHNGMWGEIRNDGAWIEPPITVRIEPRLDEDSFESSGPVKEYERTITWVAECYTDSCGRCCIVYKPVYCCRCRSSVITSVTESTAMDCNQKSTDNPVYEATLVVSVPTDAVIHINGRPTTSKGDKRVFLSKGLRYGCSYGYKVHARVMRNGNLIEDSRWLVLRPGESKNITFDFSGKASQTKSHN